MERWASCPECERPVRLTQPELEAKRGFCASCDARFEIQTGGLRDAMVPFRDPGQADVATIDAPHPGMRTLAAAGGPALQIASARSPGWLLVKSSEGVLATSLWWVLSILLGFIASPQIAFKVSFAALFPILGGLILKHYLPQRFGEDVVEIRDGALWHRRSAALRGHWRQVPFAAIGAVQIEREDADSKRPGGRWRLRIVRKTGRPLLVGSGLGHDLKAVTWLKNWVETSR